MHMCSLHMYGLHNYVHLVDTVYRILENFRGQIISLFLRICLHPRNFNYAKTHCFIAINDN